jgi:hypothetical protein
MSSEIESEKIEWLFVHCSGMPWIQGIALMFIVHRTHDKGYEKGEKDKQLHGLAETDLIAPIQGVAYLGRITRFS